MSSVTKGTFIVGVVYGIGLWSNCWEYYSDFIVGNPSKEDLSKIKSKWMEDFKNKFNTSFTLTANNPYLGIHETNYQIPIQCKLISKHVRHVYGGYVSHPSPSIDRLVKQVWGPFKGMEV